MRYSTISEFSNNVGKELKIRGWMFNKRSSGSIYFLQLRDGTGRVQGVVIKGEVEDSVFELAERLTMESSVEITGVVREDKRAPGGYELTIKDIKVIQIADEDYPIQKKEHGVDFLLTNRHLWIRSERQMTILKIRAFIMKASCDFFDGKGFVRVDTPILTPASCEGTTTLFETDYFGEKVYLAQSGQLYNEATIMAFGKTYCFGPTFRAEKSKTRRHCMEFWMLEPEIAFYGLDENMTLQEEYISYLVEQVLKNHTKELKLLERDISALERVKPPFPRITYKEAIERLKSSGVSVEFGDVLGADEETALSGQFDRPFFVHHFPSNQKAFYMKRDPDDETLSLSVDLLAPEDYGEIIGGGVREDNIDLLRQRMKEEGLDEAPFKWYLDLRRYGSVPHSGFGLGIERTVMWICSLHHIREALPFPRLLGRVYP
ncbi:MAG: asparagine--tRNA ligase [bacterium]